MPNKYMEQIKQLCTDLGKMEFANLLRDRIKFSDKQNYSPADIYDMINQIIQPVEDKITADEAG